MEKSASIKHLAAALQAFQMKADKIGKDSKNPFFNSKYASLSHILETIQIPLAESGLSFSQLPDGDNLTTILMHAESGEYIIASYSIRAVPDYYKEKDKTGNVVFRGDLYYSPQSIGSAITYARRYAIGAILGLNIDEDDDGNQASKPETKVPADDRPWLNENTKEFEGALKKLSEGKTTIEKIKEVRRLSKTTEDKLIKSVQS